MWNQGEGDTRGISMQWSHFIVRETEVQFGEETFSLKEAQEFLVARGSDTPAV